MLEFLVFYIIFSGFVTASFYLEDDVKWYWAIPFGFISGSTFFPIILGSALCEMIKNKPLKEKTMRTFFVAYTDFDNNIFTNEVVLNEGEKANENTFKLKIIDTPNAPFPYEILSWSLIEE